MSSPNAVDFVAQARAFEIGAGDTVHVAMQPLGTDATRALVRGERPVLLVEADASDPAATGNAIAALAQIVSFSPAGAFGQIAWLCLLPAGFSAYTYARWTLPRLPAGVVGAIYLAAP